MSEENDGFVQLAGIIAGGAVAFAAVLSIYSGVNDYRDARWRAEALERGIVCTWQPRVVGESVRSAWECVETRGTK